jgi:hypothetical protein
MWAGREGMGGNDGDGMFEKDEIRRERVRMAEGI